MTNRQAWISYAQIMRLPNVFTAFADILLASAAVGGLVDRLDLVLLLLMSSGCYYSAGMVLNDIFDRKDDARWRPHRPIPSGRISVWTACILGIGLMTLALATAGVIAYLRQSHHPISIAVALMIAIVLYDSILKHIWLGPVGMGVCRFLNILFGLSIGETELFSLLNLHLAGIIGVYIVGVTWFARTEEFNSNRRALIAASIVMALAGVAAVLLPLHFPAGTVSPFYLYMLMIWLIGIGLPIATAIRQTHSKNVQAAIKNCILGLIILDAILATVFVGWSGLLIIFLLLPARYLGKWLYST